MNNQQSKQPLFRLAYNSIRAHKWINVRLCLVFACLAVLICLFTAFNVSIASRQQELFDNSISSNYFYGTSEADEFLTQYNLPNANKYTVGRYNFSSLMEQYVGQAVPTVTANYIALEVNGNTYHYSSEGEPNPLWLYSGNVFNELDSAELSVRFGITKPYKGRLPSDGTNEALISEDILKAYGLRPEDVVGKRIRMHVEGNLTLIPSYIDITGVILSEYYTLSGHSEAWQIAPMVVFAENNRVPFSNIDTLYVYAFDEWSSLDYSELSQIAKDSGLAYCATGSYSQRAFLERIRVIVSNIYAVIGAILVVGLVLTVMLMIDKFVRIFSHTGGVLLSCGLEQANLYKLLFAQIVIMFLFALPIALVGSIAGYALIVRLVGMGTGITMAISADLLLAFSLIGAVAVFAIAMVFFGFSALRLRKKTVKDLLTAEVE